MSIKTCKECGREVSSKAENCPHCGTPVKRKPRQIGCVGFIVIIILAVIVYNQIDGYLERRDRTRKQELAEKAEIKKRNEFDENIQKHYLKLKDDYEKDFYKTANKTLELFRKYDKLGYKDVSNIDRKVSIAVLDEKVRKIPASQAKKNLSMYKKLLKLDPQNERYKRKVAFYRTKVNLMEEEAKRKEREYQRIVKRFGPKPENSAWDGSVSCVERHLEEIAKDPESLKFEKWGKVSYNSEDGWIVLCQYRGKNSFGGYVRNLNWFVIRHGRVVDMKPADAYR